MISPNLPTFILNGFEVSIQTIYDLDWNRVESITLLKDAAATAIYGSRASNGVVVITTKKPDAGKLRFGYQYDLSVTGPDLTVYHLLNADDKLEYERLSGLYTSSRIALGLTQDDMDKLYYQKKKAVVSGVNTYWLAAPVKTALGHNHSFSVEGGANRFQYGVTARYQTLNGVMKGSDRTRYGADLQLAYTMHDKLSLTNTLSVSQVKARQSPYGRFGDYLRMNPYYPRTDTNGKPLQRVDSWRLYGLVEPNNGVWGIITNPVLNPAYDASLGSFDQSAYTQVINSLAANWQILNGIYLRGQMSITRQQATADQYVSPFSNAYFGYQGEAQKYRGKYTYSTQQETTLDGNLLLAFNKNLANHFVNATLGANVRDYTQTYRDSTIVGFAQDQFDIAEWTRSQTRPKAQSATTAHDIERLLGAFASVNYSFSNKYLLDLNARLDGSSKFGNQNKYAPFWAVGIGWNLHKERFLANLPLVNQLKIRANTGLTGEVSFESFLAKTIYEYDPVKYSYGAGAVYKAYGNEALKWQRTRNYDLGLELQLLKNRVYFAPRYYYKRTQDLLADIIVPPSVGFNSYKSNLGLMENQGLEVNLRTTVAQRKHWQLSVYANLVHNTNQIKKISESLKKYNDEMDQKQQDSGFWGTPLLRFREGESMTAIYAVRSLCIDPENGKEIYVRKDGTLTYDYSVKDIVRVGDSSPDAEGFLGGTLGVKNFFLSVHLYTRLGGDLYNQTLIDRVENADPRYNVDQRVLTSRWKQPGDRAFFKDIASPYPTYASSRFIQRDNVLELRSVNLTYETPSSITSRLWMQQLRLMVTLNDFWRWSAVRMERGLDYPFARTVTFSLQTRF